MSDYLKQVRERLEAASPLVNSGGDVVAWTKTATGRLTRTDVERLLRVAEAAQDLLMASHQLTISERSRIGVSLRNLKATLARLTEEPTP